MLGAYRYSSKPIPYTRVGESRAAVVLPDAGIGLIVVLVDNLSRTQTSTLQCSCDPADEIAQKPEVNNVRGDG